MDQMLTDLDQAPRLQSGDVLLQIELDEPRDAVKAIARDQLRETPDVVGPAVQKLRRLLEMRFLRPCKFYPESAYKLIKSYYKFKLDHPSEYNGLVPSRQRNVFNQNVLNVLPRRDQHGRRVLILKLGKNWNHTTCSLDDVFKGCVLLLEAAILEPETQICGAVVILDMDGLSWAQMLQFRPAFAKKIVNWLESERPLRHQPNCPFMFDGVVFPMFTNHIKGQKFRSRVINIKSNGLLHQHISPNCLPSSYGGTLTIPIATGAQWLQLLLVCEREFNGT
ncbi:Clavesin-1 [Operophtera brumata]|uniref:Clavesin-1 n=1 Tax=Operophtera brumata TaxID=104452 RepID=A0A0L7L5P0_OPEBR|nr:Clavesin-1 [Operophtera brumata]